MTSEKFNLLETWNAPLMGPYRDLSRIAYRERILTVQKEHDLKTNQQLNEQHPEREVRNAVPVENPPIQQQPVTQESYKARRKRLQKEEEVSNLCPRSVTKEETYDLSHAVKEDLQARRNACEDNHVEERCRKAGSSYSEADSHAISAFCQGYRINRFGLAANLRESAKKKADKAFIDAYFNYESEPEELSPFLDKIMDDLLQADISKDMFSNESFRRRGPEIKRLSDKLHGLKTLMRKCPAYFNELPAFKQQVLQQLIIITPELDDALKGSMKKRMVSLSDGEYDSQEISEDESSEIDYNLDNFEDPAEIFRTAKGLAIKDEAERRYQKDLPDILEKFDIRSKVEENSGPGQDYERYAGIYFTGAASISDYMNIAEAREMITSHPEEYAENRMLVDETYKQLYKAQDLVAESDIRTKTLDKGLQDVQSGSKDALDLELRKVCEERASQSTAENDLLHRRAESLLDVLQYLLEKGTELSDRAVPTLEQLCQSVSVDVHEVRNKIRDRGNQI